MKTFVLLAALTALVIPGLALAQVPPPTAKVVAGDLHVPQSAEKATVEYAQLIQPYFALQRSSQYKTDPHIQRITWYYGTDGLAYSNICQTPDFWVSFGRRFFLVDSGCIARYNGVTEEGVMVAQ